MRRRSLTLLTAGALALGLAACGSADTPSGSDGTTGAASGENGGDGETPHIAIISKGFQHQFWQAVKNGAEAEAERQGATITFEGPATEREVEAQITMLTNALAKDPAAIGFAALDTKAAEQALQQADGKDIPIIAFDSGVDSDLPLTTCATDSKAAAAEAAKHMSELLGGEGKVGVIVHDQTSMTGRDRQDGFLEWMEENAPNIEVLTPVVGDGDQAKSADLLKAMVAANSDLAGVYGTNEGSAIGIVKGLEELNQTGLQVIGFDSGQAQIDAIESGLMAGAITQNPVGIGECVVDAAMKAINGETLDELVDTGFYWYDQSNIDDETIQAVLYQ
ncbi:MAG: ABC transporter substrate-binding protein [Actinomycetia bacterium]|nr:ABC transporter substrate-binding protein [Actinomycetes bacterium]